jgi:hypothetical protein
VEQPAAGSSARFSCQGKLLRLQLAASIEFQSNFLSRRAIFMCGRKISASFKADEEKAEPKFNDTLWSSRSYASRLAAEKYI